ncbi:MAG: type II toxin-antitoxin system VapC family toxin [Thermoleophilia bacterium]
MADGGCYLDTSALLPYYRQEPASGSVEAFLQSRKRPVQVSRLVEVEFCSALARWVRMSEFDDAQAMLVEHAYLDDLRAGRFDLVPLPPQAYVQARDWLLGRTVVLRTLDALHLAACRQMETQLVTCDQQLHRSAERFGVPSLLLE